jgi:hypothetical protein
LDLFFVLDDQAGQVQLRRLDEILVKAEIIKLTRNLGFPEFSNDGQYLEVHSVAQMLEKLGGREDDYSNLFTARLLLLLESRAVHNHQTYDSVIRKIVESYWRDYHDHETEFRPLFLVNDIVRFWKTLCLNYEYRRNKGTLDEAQRAKNSVQNLKLKFSRMLTCFSTVIALSDGSVVEPDAVIELVGLEPLKRLERVSGAKPDTKALFSRLLVDYGWFLETTAMDNINEWIKSPEHRQEALARARSFGDNMYHILEKASTPESRRYLVI